jgi:hypothetical protein
MSWTERYKGKEKAVLLRGSYEWAPVEVPILRVMKTIVVVRHDGEELRYAADGNFRHALRERDGSAIHGPCPILALPDDQVVRISWEEHRKHCQLEERRAALIGKLREASEQIMDAVEVALEGEKNEDWYLLGPSARKMVEVLGQRERWGEALGSTDNRIGPWSPDSWDRPSGYRVRLTAKQAAAAKALLASHAADVRRGRREGFEEGKDLLRGLNTGRLTLEQFEAEEGDRRRRA